MKEQRELLPAGTDISTLPPTDILLDKGPIGLVLDRMQAESNERRDESASRMVSIQPRIFVRPRDSSIRDINDEPYPVNGFFVAVDDTYAARRIRDGSLVIVQPE